MSIALVSLSLAGWPYGVLTNGSNQQLNIQRNELMNDFSTTTNLTEVAALMSFDRGMDIGAKDLRIEGNWLMHYDEEYPKDVACYALPCGPSCFEAWDDIPHDKSPFVLAKADPATMAKLDAEYSKHLEAVT